jgi:serine/threonine-protein kinase
MVGSDLAGYRLRSVLGRGGMSVVFEAENPRLGSIVALKVLAPEIATNDVFRARFLQESRIAAGLNHPNVIPIYDVGPCDDLLYIAMRYVSGADLRAVLKAQHRISPAQALLLIGQAARALDVAHRRGLVHRDVKPGNILVERGADDDDPDHVYLADFGISKNTMSRSGLTATGEFVGTIDYIAPEQIKDEPVDGRADIYSLGCVLYECLTGRVPFVKDVDAAVIWAHVQEQPTPPSVVRPELPPGIDDVIARALAKEPDDRYQTCRDLVGAAHAALADFAAEPQTVLSHRRDSGPGRMADNSVPRSPGGPGAGEPGIREAVPGGQPPGDVPESPRRAHRGRRRATALGAVALLIVAVIGVWAATRGTSAGSSPAPAPSHTSATLAANPILQALKVTNDTSDGKLDSKDYIPPTSCHAQDSDPSVVTCTRPYNGVDIVKFQTFSTKSKLYKAYVATVRGLGNKKGNTIRVNFGNCEAQRSNGEVSWNHDFFHPKKYSLHQSIFGHLRPVHQAAGRVYCNITNSGQVNLVWTQDAGRLLGIVSGSAHADVWQWWKEVHHSIGLGGSM